MELWFFKGHSFVSKAIKFFTWSKYSHVALKFSDNKIFEAWHKTNKVQIYDINEIFKIHRKNTRIDIYTLNKYYFDEEIQELIEETIRNDCKKFLNKKYDFLGILGFLTKSKYKNNKWFCSEMIHKLFLDTNINLINAPSYKVYPGLLSYSPFLDKKREIIIKDNNILDYIFL